MSDHQNDFDCIFRPANPSDFEALHDLLTTCWSEGYSPHVAGISVARFIAEDGAGEHLRLFLPNMEVAVVNGSIVGVINQYEQYITALTVAKRFRNCLIGSSLLHNAQNRGGRRLEVADFNKEAIRFYERRGWKRDRSFDDDVFGTKIWTITMKV